MIRFLLICLLFLSYNLFAKEGESHFGIDGGYAFLDIGAEATAQRIADLSGSTVTVTYDEGAWVGRIYGDYSLSDTTLLEVGFFVSGDVNAEYTLSGASASEAYNAVGIDFSGVFKDSSGLFGKIGIHSSEVDGIANITIGGTTYAAQASSSGTGFLFGIGMDDDKNGSRFGYTYYANLGGISDADAGFLYYGFRF